MANPYFSYKHMGSFSSKSNSIFQNHRITYKITYIIFTSLHSCSFSIMVYFLLS